jgi:hypothetical protein
VRIVHWIRTNPPFYEVNPAVAQETKLIGGGLVNDVWLIGCIRLLMLGEAPRPPSPGALVAKDHLADFQSLCIKLLSLVSYLARLPSERLGRDEILPSKFECTRD